MLDNFTTYAIIWLAKGCCWMIALYRNIKNRRLELKMTQTELAEKVGYADKGMISRIENGKVDLSQSQVLKFAEALEVSPSYLMGWQENKQDFSFGEPFDSFKDLQFINRFEFEKDKTDRLREYNENFFKNKLVDYLEDEKTRELIIASEGCDDEDKQVAIDLLNRFKKRKDQL